MNISERMSREELVLMYEFAVNQLAAAQEENKRYKDALENIESHAKRIIYKADGIYPMLVDEIIEVAQSALNGGKNG